MKFYCSSILLPFSSLSLSPFLARFSQPRHTNPLETKLPPMQVYAYIRAPGTEQGEGEGQLDAPRGYRNIKQQNFSKANLPAGHRAIYHIALTNRDGDPPRSLIASSRNLNPVLHFSQIYDAGIDTYLRPPTTNPPRVSSAEPIGIDYRCRGGEREREGGGRGKKSRSRLSDVG